MENIILNIWTNYNNEILYFISTLIKIILFLGGILSLAGLLTIGERKISALIQDRVGPNRASILGFTLWGLFHPMADGFKLIIKEDFIPSKSNKFFFTIAPLIGILAVISCFAFIPFGNTIEILGYKTELIISNMNSSLFLIFAFSSLAIYSTVLGGLFSANNWGILGSVRAMAQMFSYEVILGLSLIPIFMIYSTYSLQEMIVKQGNLLFGFIPLWGIFLQPLSFLIFFATALAEAKRTPFDVVEGESEIIGYFIEYGSMRFAAFMFTEYIEIIFISMLTSIFFFGGWQVPFLSQSGFSFFGSDITLHPIIISLLQMISFAIKTIFFSVFIIVIRWTLPRFRFDQIMKLAWQFLLPLSLFNILITAFILKIL